MRKSHQIKDSIGTWHSTGDGKAETSRWIDKSSSGSKRHGIEGEKKKLTRAKYLKRKKVKSLIQSTFTNTRDVKFEPWPWDAVCLILPILEIRGMEGN